METQLYLEFDTALLCARAEEGFGRCYAATESVRRPDLWPSPVYPQPPESYNGAEYPGYANGQPPPEAYASFYSRCKPKAGGSVQSDYGGVFVLDDFSIGMLQPQTLSDGQAWSVNLETDAKTFEQLSAEGQAAVTEV